MSGFFPNQNMDLGAPQPVDLEMAQLLAEDPVFAQIVAANTMDFGPPQFTDSEIAQIVDIENQSTKSNYNLSNVQNLPQMATPATLPIIQGQENSTQFVNPRNLYLVPNQFTEPNHSFAAPYFSDQNPPQMAIPATLPSLVPAIPAAPAAPAAKQGVSKQGKRGSRPADTSRTPFINRALKEAFPGLYRPDRRDVTLLSGVTIEMLEALVAQTKEECKGLLGLSAKEHSLYSSEITNLELAMKRFSRNKAARARARARAAAAAAAAAAAPSTVAAGPSTAAAPVCPHSGRLTPPESPASASVTSVPQPAPTPAPQGPHQVNGLWLPGGASTFPATKNN